MKLKEIRFFKKSKIKRYVETLVQFHEQASDEKAVQFMELLKKEQKEDLVNTFVRVIMNELSELEFPSDILKIESKQVKLSFFNLEKIRESKNDTDKLDLEGYRELMKVIKDPKKLGQQDILLMLLIQKLISLSVLMKDINDFLKEAKVSSDDRGVRTIALDLILCARYKKNYLEDWIIAFLKVTKNITGKKLKDEKDRLKTFLLSKSA